MARQFLTVLATEQVKEAAAKRLEVSGLTVEQAEQRLNAGVGRPSDVTRAQLEQASAESTQISSSRDVTLELEPRTAPRFTPDSALKLQSNR